MVRAKISTVAEYLSAVAEVIDEWRQTMISGWPLTLWYRGVASRSNHLLVPGRYRDAFVNMRHEEEAAMLMEFKRTAPALHSGPLPIPARHTAWMTIGQHHGLPTRLLDWAESSLVGLYFAVTSARGKDDPAEPAVWMLNPDALNRRSAPPGFIPVIIGHAQDRKLVDKRWGS